LNPEPTHDATSIHYPTNLSSRVLAAAVR
jgi:hypothetical protein